MIVKVPHKEDEFVVDTLDDIYEVGVKKSSMQMGEDNEGQIVIYTGLKMVPGPHALPSTKMVIEVMD